MTIITKNIHAENALQKNNNTFVLLRSKDDFENVLNRSKSLEICKCNCWNLKPPFLVVCCNDSDEIVGGYICDKVDSLYCPVDLPNINALNQLPYKTRQWLNQSGLTYYQLCTQAKRSQYIYAWHIAQPFELDISLNAIGEKYAPFTWKYATAHSREV